MLIPAAAALLACTEEPTALGTTPSGAPTWYGEVAPLVSESCSGCHTEGGLAGHAPFDTYAQAAPRATLMASYVEQGLMPPFPARETPDCANPWGFQNDLRLSEDEIALLSRWAEAGAPEGDPAQAAPLVPPRVEELPRVDQELSLDSPLRIPPLSEQTDTMACLVLDPGLSQEAWLVGVGVMPDVTEVVHHAVLYIDASGEAEALAGPDGWYDCFGGPKVDATMIGGAIPGSSPLQAPEGSGIAVPAGARLVVQMHYHGVAEERFDRSTVQLVWADAPPERQLYLELYGNASSAEDGLLPGPSDRGAPEFRIPAGASGHTERMRYTLQAAPGVDYGVFLVANHMHLVGSGMRAWIEPAGGGQPLCLLETPRWDYNWQRTYTYDVLGGSAPVVRDGDTLVLECTYDNTEANPGVQRAMREMGLEAPVDVRLGEETLDEMCIFLGGVVPLNH